MNKQPLLAILFAIALSGCNAQKPPPADVAPVPSSLHSEFSDLDQSISFYGPFVAATQAQQDEKYSKSADYYLEALKADPDSKFVADRAFFQLLYSGRMDKAAELAVTMVQRTTELDDDLIHLMYVLSAYKKSDWASVRSRLEKGRSTGFGYIISPLLKAWSFGAEGDLVAAKLALKPLLADSRLKSIADEHTAYMLDYSQLFDEAESQYTMLTGAHKSGSLQPAIAYAQMLYKTGQLTKARSFLSEQVVRFKNHNYFLREASRITKGWGPSQIAASPQGAAGMVFLRLASEFSQSKSKQAAVLYARIASYLTPNVSDIYFLIGELMEESGNADAAAAAYNKVPIDSSLRELADVRRIGALRMGGRSDLAEELMRIKLRKGPDDISMLLGLADILQQKQEYQQAVNYYSRALKTIKKARPSDWRIYFARAVAYESLHDWPSAEKDLLTALELRPDQPEILNYLGYTWIDNGQHIDRAKSMIEKAAASRPEDGFIADSLGWVYYLTGDYPRAVVTLEKAVRLEPNDVTINDHLGDAYWRIGRKIEARFQWQHAIDNGAEGKELAEILLKLEQGLEGHP